MTNILLHSIWVGKNYLLLHSSFTFILEWSVFPIHSSDVCSKTRLIRKVSAKLYAGQMQVQCVRLACRKRLRNTSRAECIELKARLVKCFASAKTIFQCFFILNLFKNLNLCTSYIKQIMNVSHSCSGTNIFIWWNMKCTIQLVFASLNGTFHLSPHENICTSALININYLYTICLQMKHVKDGESDITCCILEPKFNIQNLRTTEGCTPLNTVPILSCVKAYSKNRHLRVFIMIRG